MDWIHATQAHGAEAEISGAALVAAAAGIKIIWLAGWATMASILAIIGWILAFIGWGIIILIAAKWNPDVPADKSRGIRWDETTGANS